MPQKRDGEMKRELKHVNKALFMIFLIVSLSLCSSIVMGAAIAQPLSVYGVKEVSGFMSRTDTITINATVFSPEDPELGPGQLKVIEDPTQAFDCVLLDPVTSASNCKLTTKQFTLPPGYGVVRFTLQIFSDTNQPMSTPIPASIIVDELPPKVYDIHTAAMPGGIVETTYTIEDVACNSNVCAGSCSGLQSIKFTVSGITVGEEVEMPEGCKATKTINLTIPVVGVEKKQLCIDAMDKLDNSGQQCQMVIIDTKAPEVSGVLLMKTADPHNPAGGKPVQYTNGLPISPVIFVVNFTEDSKLIPESVVFDLSSINAQPAFKEAYANTKALSCAGPSGKDNNKWSCQTGGLIVYLAEPTTITIGIKAKDEFNNSLDSQQTLNILFEKEPPVPTKFYTDYIDDKGNYWLKAEGNDVKLDFTESGSGLANKQVYVDFGELGLQTAVGSSSTVLIPNECVGGWTCVWKYLKTDKPTHSQVYTRVIEPTQDDAGNHLTAPFVGVFFVDKHYPDVKTSEGTDISGYINLTAIGEKHDPMSIISTGDKVEIKVYVAEQSGLSKAVANFTALTDDRSTESVEGTCVENQIIGDTKDRIYECTFTSPAPVIPGYVGPLSGVNDLRINFQFTDLMGYVGNYTYPEKSKPGLEVLYVENQSVQTWKYKRLDFSPSAGLDRLVWSLFPQRFFQHFKLEAVSGRNPQVLSLQLNPEDCTGLEYVNVEPDSGKYFITLFDMPNYASQPKVSTLEDVAVIEMNPASTPEVYREVNGTQYAVNDITIDCVIRVTSIVKTGKKGEEKAITMPDLVNTSFIVPVFNNPLGQNIGNMQERVDELQEDIDRWDWITTIRKIFEVAKQICGIMKTLIQINAIFAGVRDMVAGTCDTPAGGAAGMCSISATSGRISTTQDNFIVELMYRVSEFCDLFIACKPSLPPQGDACTSTWCDVQRTWTKYSQWWINLNNEYLNPNLGFDAMSQGEKDSLIKERQDAGKSTDPKTLRSLAGEQKAPLFDYGSFDVQKSIFTSVISFCLPGIILNLDKYLQIQCKRLLCYKIDVPSGRPIWRCDKEYDYLTCNYWTGALVNVLPIFQFLDQLSQILADIARQPLQLIGWVLDKACNLVICSETNPHNVGCVGCRILEWGTALTNIIADLVEGGLGDRFSAATFDLCSEALEDSPSYEDIGLPGPPGQESEAAA
jgi:hypothetical protein